MLLEDPYFPLTLIDLLFETAKQRLPPSPIVTVGSDEPLQVSPEKQVTATVPSAISWDGVGEAPTKLQSAAMATMFLVKSIMSKEGGVGRRRF